MPQICLSLSRLGAALPFPPSLFLHWITALGCQLDGLPRDYSFSPHHSFSTQQLGWSFININLVICFRIFQYLPIFLSALTVKSRSAVMVYKIWQNPTLLSDFSLTIPNLAPYIPPSFGFLSDPDQPDFLLAHVFTFAVLHLSESLGLSWHAALSLRIAYSRRSSFLLSVRNVIWRPLSEALLFIYSFVYYLSLPQAQCRLHESKNDVYVFLLPCPVFRRHSQESMTGWMNEWIQLDNRGPWMNEWMNGHNQTVGASHRTWALSVSPILFYIRVLRQYLLIWIQPRNLFSCSLRKSVRRNLKICFDILFREETCFSGN